MPHLDKDGRLRRERPALNEARALVELQDRVLAALPDAVVEIDLGVASRGGRFLALQFEGHEVIVEYGRGGLGVTSVPDDIGFTEPHEVYEDLDAATERTIVLLSTGEWTTPHGSSGDAPSIH